jgi:hypothetical protein
MYINIAENYHRLATEVTTNWKTGAVMTGVAVVVGQVYGKVAALFVLLIAVSNYQIVGQQIRVISWMSLRKALIAVVVLGNSYYNIINPQIMSNIAIAIVLIDNFQLSSINVDLSNQNKIMKQNEEKVAAAYVKLGDIEKTLAAFHQSVAEAEQAKAANAEKAETLSQTIPVDTATRLENVNALIEALMKSADLRELVAYEKELRASIESMLSTYSGICEQLKPLIPKIEGAGSAIEATALKLEATVHLSRQQVIALQHVVRAAERYREVIV